MQWCSVTKATVTGWGARKPSGLGSSQLSHGRVQSTPFQTPDRQLQRLWSLRDVAQLPGSPGAQPGSPAPPGSPELPSSASSSPRLGDRDGTLLASSSQDPAQGQLRAGAPANGNWTNTRATPVSRQACGRGLWAASYWSEGQRLGSPALGTSSLPPEKVWDLRGSGSHPAYDLMRRAMLQKNPHSFPLPQDP